MTFKDPGIIFSFVAASNSSISAEICAFAFPRPEITVPCKEIVLSELIEPVPYALSIFLVGSHVPRLYSADRARITKISFANTPYVRTILLNELSFTCYIDETYSGAIVNISFRAAPPF